MLIVGIETSCDDTSVAFFESDTRTVLQDNTFSQSGIHSKFGGVVPEVASRNHLLKLPPLFAESLERTGKSMADIGMIAVTSAPGLIGALLVGTSFAKGLAFILDIPVFPTHHLAGHILSAELSDSNLKPPYTALVASGGHTHIYAVEEPLKFKLLGRTVDDAAGESFDKVAKALGGSYPGGPFIERLAIGGDPLAIKFPIAMRNSDCFSFSGLKTAVINRAKSGSFKAEDIAASFQLTVAETLAEKVVNLAKRSGHNRLVAAGGVAANAAVRRIISAQADAAGITAYFPKKELCGDNASMIAYAAYRITRGKDISSYKRLDFKAGDTLHEIEI
jgi:N6-L-threonylcarbamoyladenine synthase